MTQEIGFVEPFDKEEPIDFEKFPIGSSLELLQYHSCDTAARYSVGFVGFGTIVALNNTEFFLYLGLLCS